MKKVTALYIIKCHIFILQSVHDWLLLWSTEWSYWIQNSFFIAKYFCAELCLR